MAFDELCVGLEPREDEHPPDVEIGTNARRVVFEYGMRDALRVAGDFRYDRVADDLDLRVRERALLQKLGGAELVTAMHQVHLARVAREIVGFLDGGVAAPDHGEALALEERTVTHRAIRDTLAGKLLFPGHAELDGCATGGEDHRLTAIAVAARGLDVEPAVGVPRDSLDGIGHDPGAQLLRVFGHFLRPLPPPDALEADVVFDEVGVEELSARRTALDRDRVEHATARVKRRTQPCRAGAHDDHVVDECGTVRHTSRNSSRGGSPSPARARAKCARNCMVSNSISGCCGPASFSSAAAPTTTMPWRV